jgi:hypothetical protein
MSYEETRVFKLIDGQNTVQDVVEKSLLGKYTATKTLMQFLENDYIELINYDVSENLQSKFKNYVLEKHVLTFVGYAVLAVLGVGLFSVSPPNINSTFTPFIDRFTPTIPSFNQYDYIKVAKVKNGLQVYFWENGKYPKDLQDLVAANILKKQEIADSDGTPYSYSSNGLTYFLN